MKVLLVLALVLWLGAGAVHVQPNRLQRHNTAHHLHGAPWITGTTHRYGLTITMTAGIPGMAPQVSKSVVEMDVDIIPKTDTEFLLQIPRVRVSKPKSSVDNYDSPMTMVRSPELERDLSKTITFTYEEGKVKSYTLGVSESLASKTIKRGILRHFQMKTDYLSQMSEDREDNSELYPIVYNSTETDELGTYDVYYGLISGPNPWFPNEDNVFNISKTMNYEPYGYPSFHEHHNFLMQGCPDVCRVGENPPDNKYGAGCPGGYELHQMPLKAGRIVHHNLRLVRGKMVIERINAQENTIASLYDQDMVVTIYSDYLLKETSSRRITDPDEHQTHYTELNTLPTEDDIRNAHPSKYDDVSSQYRWIYGIFDDVRSSEMLQVAMTVWEKVANSILTGDIESTHGQEVAQDVSQLQNVLALLKTSDLNSLWSKVVDVNALRRAPEKEKIKRQIFLDILPLTGTDEAVECIKYLIHERKLSTWEAKEVLEAIPENLIDPKEKNVRDLWALLELPHVKRHHIVHSAAYITVSSVIRNACIVKSQCSRSTEENFLQDVHSKLKSTKRLEEKYVYIKAIANVGHKKCLELLKPYVYGTAEDMDDLSTSDKDFLKKEAVMSLFFLVESYPYEILEMIAPVFFNRTETPAIRMPAFTVLMYCQPSLAILQHIAQDSWDEPSIEVGNYIYSTFTTVGNSTIPCQKDLADRIKLVVSQMKTFDFGVQNSKFLAHSFFDELRNYGIDNRFALVQNNESFIPTFTFGEVKYNIHSLTDLLGFVLHAHELSVDDVFRAIDIQRLGVTLPRDIPNRIEREIFGSLQILPTLPKELRITLNKRIFYASSFHYVDAESIHTYFTPLLEHLRDHLNIERGALRGNLVKIFIPSSIHSTTYSSIGFPVDFRMKHPLVLSLKVESRRQRSSGPSTSYYIRPSVYYATYHEKTILNTANSHIHGVYHEEKHTFTLPMEISFSANVESNSLEFTYKMPEIPKRIYRRHSEAGTFVTDMKLRKLLAVEYSKEPMKTPALFERKRSVNGFGFPELHVAYHTEDFEDEGMKLPRDSDEFFEQVFDAMLNAGWSKKDVNITIASPSSTSVNEMIFRISYNRSLDMASQTQISEGEDESDIQSRILPSGRSRTGLEDIAPEHVEQITRAFGEGLSKVAHELSLEMETRPARGFASLRVEYNRTLDRMVHNIQAWGEAQLPQSRKPYKICLSNLMRYMNIPSELHYNIREYSEQVAPTFTAISIGDRCKPLAQSDIIAKSLFEKISPEELFAGHDFAERPDQGAFMPETHEQCLKDIEDGNSNSAACISVVGEESHFNKWSLRVVSEDELKPEVKNITDKLDHLMKHYYYENVDINSLNVNNPRKTFEMTVKYFDKLTHTPVLDIFMKKPKEHVLFEKIDPGYYFQPPSGIYTALESHLLHISNNSYPPSCALTKKYVRTFNMEEYPLPEDTCTYVLSTHCTERKKFAVLAKTLDSSDDTKEVTVYIADKKAILRPSRTSGFFTVIYNQNPIEVTSGKPKLLDPESQLYVFLEAVYGHDISHVLSLYAEKAGIKIQYCGKNIKLKVNPLYKGQLCGLCGRFDGETAREFRGSSRCLHLDSEDFAHSFITDSDNCGVSTEPKKPVLCPSGEHNIPGGRVFSPSPNRPSLHQRYPSKYDPTTDSEDQILSDSIEPIQRNMIIRRYDNICFSTQAVPFCPDGSSPIEQHPGRIQFHCRSQRDPLTRRLVVEATRRVLTELYSESVDFVKSLFVPTSCSNY